MATTSASSDLVIVLSTFPNADDAGEVARSLVSEGVCACVNIVPGVHSVYQWNNEVVSRPEVLCVIKTHRDRHAELLARLEELHPYDVPELVTLGADAVNDSYLRWVVGETKR